MPATRLIGACFPFSSVRTKGALALMPRLGTSQLAVDAIWDQQGSFTLSLCAIAHLKITTLPTLDLAAPSHGVEFYFGLWALGLGLLRRHGAGDRRLRRSGWLLAACGAAALLLATSLPQDPIGTPLTATGTLHVGLVGLSAVGTHGGDPARGARP